VKDGQVTILPWSYHLSFGGYPSGLDVSQVINFPIDTPVYGVSMEERPLLDKLLEITEYRARYHEYLRQIVEGYIDSGLFEETIHQLDEKIGGLVANDITSVYAYEQYLEAVQDLTNLGLLRSESIKGQLNGTIPSKH